MVSNYWGGGIPHPQDRHTGVIVIAFISIYLVGNCPIFIYTSYNFIYTSY